MSEITRAELLVAAALDHIRDEEGSLEEAQIALEYRADRLHLYASSYRADCLARASALLGDEWQPISTAPKVAGRIEVRSVITYRWLPYKPQSEQAKRGIKGRWQFPTSDYGGWTNGELPHNAEWRPLPVPPQGGDRG